MDGKGDNEQITYPNIFFSIDNYEEVALQTSSNRYLTRVQILSNITVRDGEVVCVELVANDKKSEYSVSLFNGTVHYESLRTVYYAKVRALVCAEQMLMSLSLQANTKKRNRSRGLNGVQVNNELVEFVKMRGPSAIGCAELALSQVEQSKCATPTEGDYPLLDGDWDQLEVIAHHLTNSHSKSCCRKIVSISSGRFCSTARCCSLFNCCFCRNHQDNPFNQRRMSDPASSLKNYVLGWHSRRMQKSKSENEGVDGYAIDTAVIDSLDIRDGQLSCSHPGSDMVCCV